VPQLPGGTYTLRAKNAADGTILATTSFTIEPSIVILHPTQDIPLTSGFSRVGDLGPTSGTALRIRLLGWKPGETLAFGGLPLVTATGTPFATETVGDDGSKTTSVLYVDFASAGVKTATAVGPFSGVKSTTFRVDPKIIIFHSATDFTTRFSMLGTTPTSIFLEGYGFPAGIIGGNTITVAGVTGVHAPIRVDATGRFVDATGNPIRAVVSFTTALPLGPTSLVAAGTTFNFANGNIQPPPGLARGALIISIPGAEGGTAVITLDKASYRPDPVRGDFVWVFGYGFRAPPVSAPTLTSTASGLSFPSVTVDGNGAIFTRSTGRLGNNKFADYTVSAEQTGLIVISASFSIDPFIRVSDPVPAVADYGFTVTVEGRGFKHGESVTVTIAGVSFGTPVTVASDGTWSVSTGLPAVPFGTQTFTATSPTVTKTTTISVKTLVTGTDPAPAAPGDTVTFASGKITGLKASTAYQITLGAHTGAPVLAEFTSDSRGKSPAVSFTMPTAITETHIIDVREKATGLSAIYGNLRTTDEQYTNLFIFARTTLTLSPSRGGVGTEITLDAAKLRAGKEYTVKVDTDVITSFKATSDGRIPSGTTITISDRASEADKEIGTPLTVSLETTVDATTETVGSATFVFFATATLDKSEASPGDAITISAKGLNHPGTYEVRVGFVSAASPGILVGSIVSAADGTGSTTFIVPDGLPTGTQRVQLVRGGLPRLLSPPSFTIKAAVALFDSATFKASAKTDKPSYRVGEEFKVSFLLKTTTGAARFDYVVTVKDPDGRVLYPISAATGISVDTIGTTITVTYAVPTGAKAGTWTASIVILQAGAVVDVAVITFTVS
jgi:hypothetical protein